ncbi:MAG: DUF4198 domain-containing protein [Pseudomonadota bacterium]
MGRFIFLAILFVAAPLFVAVANAHDFWLAPQTNSETPEQTSIALLVGHSGEKQPWAVRSGRIETVLHILGDDRADMTAKTRASIDLNGAMFDVETKTAGTHIIALESNDAFITLKAKKFNLYVEEEGLTTIRDHREKQNLQSRQGREFYSRRAKALIQVGDIETDVTKPLGHTLEIVPLVHPRSLRGNEAMPIRVLYNGAPAPGLIVDLESLTDGTISEINVTTDEAGEALLPLIKEGQWKVDVVWGEPIDHPKAEYRTVFASLTFGYD